MKRGRPATLVFPDQGEKSLGTFIIPNTVALIANASHPRESRELIDFLLSKEVEQQLVGSGFCHIPSRRLAIRPVCADVSYVKTMEVNMVDVYKQVELVKKELTQVFIR
jgi:ABC-type Fe3+ transport system substrate-binding protein